mgnify:CR=1 FL=1
MIRQLRRRHGLTQTQLAMRAGLAQSAISMYERGRKQPTTEVLNRIANACGEQVQLVPITRIPQQLIETLLMAEHLPRRHRQSPPVNLGPIWRQADHQRTPRR